MKILVLDTSTDSCCAALFYENKVYCKTIFQAKKHNELIIPTIDQLLLEHQLKLKDIDYYACGIGPGSFVGVRLGVSVIQGLAYGFAKPIVKFSSMSAVAIMVMEKQNINSIQVALDAKMGDVYYGSYHKNADGVLETRIEKSLELSELKLGDTTKDLVGDGFQLITFDKSYSLHQAGPLSLRFIMPTILEKINSNDVLLEVDQLQPVYLQGTKNWQKKA